jgi:hypothetical protein
MSNQAPRTSSNNAPMPGLGFMPLPTTPDDAAPPREGK